MTQSVDLEFPRVYGLLTSRLSEAFEKGSTVSKIERPARFHA